MHYESDQIYPLESYDPKVFRHDEYINELLEYPESLKIEDTASWMAAVRASERSECCTYEEGFAYYGDENADSETSVVGIKVDDEELKVRISILEYTIFECNDSYYYSQMKSLIRSIQH